MAKTLGLVTEMISANTVKKTDHTNWQKEEEEWYNKFSLVYSKNKQSPAKSGKGKKKWKLKGTQNEIEQWIQEQNTFTLQFDGASKNNLRQAGAGGIITDQNGQVIATY